MEGSMGRLKEMRGRPTAKICWWLMLDPCKSKTIEMIVSWNWWWFFPYPKNKVFFSLPRPLNNGLPGLMLWVIFMRGQGFIGWRVEGLKLRIRHGLMWEVYIRIRLPTRYSINVFFIVYIHWYYTQFMFCTIALVHYHIHDLTISYGIVSYHGGTTLLNCLHVLNLMISFLHFLLKFFDPPKKMEVISENFHKSRSNVLFFSCQVLELSGEATRRETQRISRLGGVTKILVI